MIIIPHSSIELEKDETIDAACDRIRKTRVATQKGNIVSAHMKVNGIRRKLVCAYAPPKNTTEPTKTRTYFFKRLRVHMTRDAVLALDANCVPDPAIDHKSSTNATYPNEGADELAKLVCDFNLLDVTRATLGEEPFYTAHHITVNGAHTHTRIDQIYAPMDDRTQWDHVTCEDYLRVGDQRNRKELDHRTISVKSKSIKPKRGNDIQKIDEKIFDDPTFNLKVLNTIIAAAQTVDPTRVNPWLPVWEALKQKLKRMCVTQTRMRKYVQDGYIEIKRKELAAVRNRFTRGVTTDADVQLEKELWAEIRKKSKEDYTLHQTLEREAYDMGKSHDSCTAEFYRPWHETHAAQHIESMKRADWTNPSEPIFTGTIATDQKEVLSELTKYYTSLFKKKQISQEAMEACQLRP